MTVWYPLEEKISNLEDVNSRLKVNHMELVSVTLDDTFPASVDLHQDTIDTINSTLPNLKSRLSSSGTVRKPDVAMILCDDAVNWPYIYQALFMGQLMHTGDEKWQFYRGYEHELPSEEDLATIKTIIIPGSGHAVYNEHKVSWISPLKAFIRRVMNECAHIRIIGGCFGEQITASAMGGKVEKMPYNAERPKCLGREQVQLSDEFYE